MNDSTSTIQYANDMADTTSWSGADMFNVAMTIIVIQAIVCGVVALLIAQHNERNPTNAFIAGFFMGPLGVMMYAIMGETIGLRIHLEQIALKEHTGKRK